MQDVTKLLDEASDEGGLAAERLLPLVYNELRELAAAKLRRENPGVTLQATALVHEAYLRLVGDAPDQGWAGRAQFFAAAAEAMRRILVERARRKKRLKHGGEFKRVAVPEDSIVAPEVDERVLELDTALSSLESEMPRQAGLVKLRYFVGLSSSEAADVLGVSRATADRDWAFARAWLYRSMGRPSEPAGA